MKRRRGYWRLIFLVPFLLFLLSLMACHTEPVSPQDARVLIIDPPAESTQDTNDVTIQTFIERFEVVNKIGQQNSPGEGHLVYYKDVTPPMEQGKSALSAEGTYVISTETTYTWSNIQSGRHTFWVQLVNNDNTPLEPQAAVRVYTTVE